MASDRVCRRATCKPAKDKGCPSTAWQRHVTGKGASFFRAKPPKYYIIEISNAGKDRRCLRRILQRFI